MTKSQTIMGVLLSLMLVLMACAGQESSSTTGPDATIMGTADPGSTTAATATATPGPTSIPPTVTAVPPTASFSVDVVSGSATTRYINLLGHIPDTPETRSHVFILDYAVIRKLFDVPLPGPEANETEMEEYYKYGLPQPWTEAYPDYSALPGAAPFLSDGYDKLRAYRAGHRKYLGFDIRNEDQTIIAGVPGRQLEVLSGRFDPTELASALGMCSDECTPPDAEEEYEGSIIYIWGEDFKNDLTKRLVPPVFDQLGSAGRLAIRDNHAFRTRGTDDMKSLIDASLAARPSLADVEEYELLANGMSELGVYAMFFTDQTQGFEETLSVLCQGLGKTMGDQDCLGIGAHLEETEPMLRRYKAFATGVGKDEQGAYTALVLVHADDRSASDNVGLLRRRLEDGNSLYAGKTWGEFFDTDRLEISAEGSVLFARLRPIEGIPPHWIKWVFRQGQLLLHEPAPGFVLPTPGPVAPITPPAPPAAPRQR